jgi:sugar/nucleoside kinase (ribokinase family)
MSRTSFLAIGHASRDEFPDGQWRLGGSALYGAATAAKLGADVTLVTRVGPAERGALETLCGELGITPCVLSGDVTTTFGFSYDAAGSRTLRLLAKAAPITRADVGPLPPPSVVFLGSVARELGPSLFEPWPGAMVVLAAQGMLRGVDRWAQALTLLPHVAAVVVSEEDGADDLAWRACTTVVVTRGERGSDVYAGATTTHVPAFRADAVADPTGAGDAYAAALGVGLAEGLDIVAAATFASAAASFAVEGLGMSGLADRGRVRERMGARA